jgi:hypothetical protein
MDSKKCIFLANMSHVPAGVSLRGRTHRNAKQATDNDQSALIEDAWEWCSKWIPAVLL